MVNSVIIFPIQGPNIMSVIKIVISFGIKDNVGSCICVVACIMLINSPTIKPKPKIGADIIIATVIALCATSITMLCSIKTPL